MGCNHLGRQHGLGCILWRHFRYRSIARNELNIWTIRRPRRDEGLRSLNDDPLSKFVSASASHFTSMFQQSINSFLALRLRNCGLQCLCLGLVYDCESLLIAFGLRLYLGWFQVGCSGFCFCVRKKLMFVFS
jgi:hypothetical protein